MDNAILLIIATLAGLLIGGVGAWFIASRPVAELRERLDAKESESRQADADLSEARVELASARERTEQADQLTKERAAQVERLGTQLEEARTKRAALAERLASLESAAEERSKAFEEQKRLLIQAREEMLTQFKATGAEVLKANQEDFLKRAEARFRQSEEAGEQKIKA